MAVNPKQKDEAETNVRWHLLRGEEEAGGSAPLSAEDTGSLQWQRRSAKIIGASSPCAPGCERARAPARARALRYFSSCELAASSQGFFEGLIDAQDLGLRLTLEEGLS